MFKAVQVKDTESEVNLTNCQLGAKGLPFVYTWVNERRMA